MRELVLTTSRVNCSLGKAMAVLGERWALLVLREAFYGLRRFDDFLATVGCARNVLAARLTSLVDDGVLARVPYQDEGQRTRFEYRLTPKGHDLYPILIALLGWGDRWLAEGKGPPVQVHHRGCGAVVTAEIRCADGHGPLTARDTEPVLSAGARRADGKTEKFSTRGRRALAAGKKGGQS